MSLAPVQPDDVYCVYCHAPAAGPCASCGALICAECGEISGGTGKPAVVCRDCHRKGRGRVGLGFWLGLLWPILLVALALFVVLWLLRGGLS